MDWTFGIITDGTKDHYLLEIIDSIISLNVPNYEIIIVGNTNIQTSQYIKVIPFNEQEKYPQIWISRKKNIIAQLSQYENISLSHDYIKFDINWYKHFEEFGSDWDVCMNRIINLDNLRFRDWTLWPPKFIDYNDLSQTDNMYASGSFYCVKKEFAIKYPLDENLMWGEGEDLEWSKSVRSFWKYRCNQKSIVRFLKMKDHNPVSNPDL
jgi:hypothetical protein